MTCGHLLHNRTKIAILPLEAALIFGQEPVEIMEEHPVESDALWMSGTVNSCHGKQRNSRNEPEGCWIPEESDFPWKEETMNEALRFTMSTEVNNPPNVLSTNVVSKRQDSKSAWWQFERLQKMIYPRLWEYSDTYLDVRKKLNQMQNNIFEEKIEMEKRALEAWKLGNSDVAKELLSNFTYEKLAAILDKVLEIIIHLTGAEGPGALYPFFPTRFF
ncbi:MAG: hypothetical protein ACETWK_09985 [Candidatus Aminicenantaceae bacterium]